MKLASPSVVHPSIIEQSARDIDAVNAYIDGMKGTVISIETIRSGQQGAYKDTVYESLIFCHQPNLGLTNGPLVRVINEAQAKEIARIFVCGFEDEPKTWSSPRLEFIRPEPNPCGLKEHQAHTGKGYHSCWRVCIRLEYTG